MRTWVLAIISSPLQVLAFLVLRLASRFVLVRARWIITPRLGHLAANFELMLLSDLSIESNAARLQDKRTVEVSVWLPSQYFVCNKTLFGMISRRVRVLPYWATCIAARLNEAIPGGGYTAWDLARTETH